MAFYHRFKRQFLSRIYLVRIFLVLLILSSSYTLLLLFKPLGQTVISLWHSAQTPLPNYFNRTNFLLLGRSGQGYDAPDLTDTIIMISIHQDTGDTVLLTIPRDLWIPSLRAKINTAYYYGNQKQGTDGGIILAKSAVSESLDQPIHFTAIIDFASFERFIDLLGGVDITVDTAFDDSEFPIPGRENDLCGGDPQTLCRYEHIRFDSGSQHMDGKTALKFIRSRNAEGDEGTDFARSARQEKLILAVKDKLLSRKILTNTKLLKSLYENVSKSIVTDIKPEIYPALIKLGLKSVKTRIRTAAISESLVYHPPLSKAQDFQWVLLPKDNNPKIIFEYVLQLLTQP